MTRRQRHLIDLSHVPCGDDHATGIGIILQLIQHILDLVYRTSFIVGPRAPLVTIHGTQFSILISPLVPDADTVFLEVFHVGIAFQEPEQFVDDTLQMEFFRGQQGEPIVEVITTLGTKDADGTCSCTVTFLSAFCQDAVEDV